MPENEEVLDTEDQDVDPNVEVTDQDPNVTDTDDPVEAAISAAVAAKLEALREQAEQEAKREYGERVELERRAREDQERANELYNSFGSTIREVRDNLKRVKVIDSEGNERTLTDDEFQDFIAEPLNRYNLKGEQALTLKALTSLAAAAMDTLPEQVRPEFTKRASNKPLDEWLKTYAEVQAEQSGFVKSLKAQHEAAIKAAEARGFKRGQGTAAAPPPQDTNSQSRPNAPVDLTTLSGAARALSQGRITDDEYLAIHRKFTS